MPIIGIGLRWGAVPATTQAGFRSGFGWLRYMGAVPDTAPETSPSDTHDGGGYDWEGVRGRYRRAEEDRDKTARKRKESERRLRDAIEVAYNRALRIEPEAARRIEAAVPDRRAALSAPLRRADFRALARDLDAVRGMLASIMVREAAAEDRLEMLAVQAAEEDDIEALLLMAVH